MLALHRRHGGAPIPTRWAWAPIALFLVAPYVLIQTAVNRRVEWRGREYQIRGNAALAPGSSTEQRDRERHDDGRMEALTQSDPEPEADSHERNDAERQQVRGGRLAASE
jgi:hypothetical protein